MPTPRSIAAGSPPRLSSCSLNGEILSMPDRDSNVDRSNVVSYYEDFDESLNGAYSSSKFRRVGAEVIARACRKEVPRRQRASRRMEV